VNLRLLTVLGLACACQTPDDSMPAVPSGALLSAMEGDWLVVGERFTDCPMDSVASLPMGKSQWVRDDAELVIASSQVAELRYAVLDEQRLVAAYSETMPGCTVTVERVLTVDTYSPYTAAGSETAHFSTEGGRSCTSVLRERGLPTSCSVELEWQGRRLH